MVMDSISTFAGAFRGGARAYLFRIENDDDISTKIERITGITLDIPYEYYLVKSLNFPGENLEEITTYWMGFEKKWSGSIRYNDWTVSFQSDRNNDLYMGFDAWCTAICNVDADTGIRSEIADSGTPGYSPPGFDGYELGNISMLALDYDLSEQMRIKLINTWPKEVSAPTLDHSSQEILTFDVTFSYERLKIS
jgi:hypothetical protein